MTTRFGRLLHGLAPAIVREVEREMYAAGSLVATTAQQSITEGAQSGKGHVASRPGEPPNNDTATLANGIEVLQVERLKVAITSTAPYSAALEFGTSKMGARPFMAPAANATRPAINAKLRKAAQRAIRRHFRS